VESTAGNPVGGSGVSIVVVDPNDALCSLPASRAWVVV
jgi:hypothetical protein